MSFLQHLGAVYGIIKTRDRNLMRSYAQAHILSQTYGVALDANYGVSDGRVAGAPRIENKHAATTLMVQL